MTIGDPSHAEINRLLVDERARLLDLLRTLEPPEWDRPTECPAWTVKGIVTHLLGDDLSILSRQRDGVASAVAAAEPGAARNDALDRFNQEWVLAASFLSVDVLLDLLGTVGAQVHAWYASVDPERLGETIQWMSPDPAPYRVLAAREYLERWVHHQQIRRALDRPAFSDAAHSVPAVAVAMLGFPQALTLLPAADGTSIVVAIPDADSAWTLSREAGAWHLVHREEPAATVRLSVDLDTATALFSRGLLHQEVGERIEVTGDAELGSLFAAGIAAFFGRPPS